LQHGGDALVLLHDVRAPRVVATLEIRPLPPEIDEIARPVGGRLLAGQGADGAVEIRVQLHAGIFVGHADAVPAYAVPRRSSFCGRWMKHSGWWPDYVIRLFRRDAARFSDDQAHERLVVNGAIRKLKQPLLHEAITDLDQMLGKMNLYSTASARSLHARGRRASVWSALLHGGWAFFRTYVLRAGFLDGREGFILAVANAEGSYYRYLKLMLLGKNRVDGKS